MRAAGAPLINWLWRRTASYIYVTSSHLPIDDEDDADDDEEQEEEEEEDEAEDEVVDDEYILANGEPSSSKFGSL